MSAAYLPALKNDEEEEEDFHDELQPPSRTTSMRPLEMGADSRERSESALLLRRVRDDFVWPHLALVVTIWLVCPTLALGMFMAFSLTGRIWTCALFSLHLTLALIKARTHINELVRYEILFNAESEKPPSNLFPTRSYTDSGEEKDGVVDGQSKESDEEDDTVGGSPEEQGRVFHSKIQEPKGVTYFVLTSLPSLMDILLFGVVYPTIGRTFDGFFIDSDGEPIVEWLHYYRGACVIRIMCWIIVAARLAIASRMILVRIPASVYYLTTFHHVCITLPVLGKCVECFYHFWLLFKICFSSPPRPLICWKILTVMTAVGSAVFLSWTIYSAVIHFERVEPVELEANASICDPLDTTECCLPFPSFYHLTEDSTTDTGYRVNLNPDSFPKLRGRIPFDVGFLNHLDGFSTMGPILFYLEGMKESHEKYVKLATANPKLKTEIGVTRLRGHEELDLSVTPFSTTLLLDVDGNVLVPHSAEIDYLDPKRPLVMVFPAKPLRHNGHYALAVINATDIYGDRLPPTQGMIDLWEAQEGDRKERYSKTIIPAFERATKSVKVGESMVGWGGPFGSFARIKDPQALQLLFDFKTISKQSQLGPLQSVRDGTLHHVGAPTWNWLKHTRAIRQIDYACEDHRYPLARTIQGELDVPWFLNGFGPGYRGSILDHQAVLNLKANTIGQAKFVVHIPCSLKLKALDIESAHNITAQPLRAVMEFGHGLFYHRQEAGSGFLIQQANEHGYVIVAMDWRGMSHYDYPLVLRTMLAEPALFESVRDNLIQGYANKFALQHFVKVGMLEHDWLKFSPPEPLRSLEAKAIPQETGEAKLPSVFYGISQGGILGAGYVAASGSTGLIDRAVLGVPGTPFSLVLSRSLEFIGYDAALLLNFYDNRDVRIFLSLAQMCWDSVEAAGLLAQPVEEPIPPIILQAGLGDPIVPTLAAERLARALGASVLPNNPRQNIYGIPPGAPDGETSQAPHAILTEMLYTKDYASLPLDDKLTANDNDVHDCVRMEAAMQKQMNTFFTTGKVMDPCGGSTTCVKPSADCFKKP